MVLVRVAAVAPRLLRFSTTLLPEQNRFKGFRDVFGEVLRADWVDLTAGKPHFELTYLDLGSVGVGSLCGTAGQVTRDARQAESDASFFLGVVAEGAHHSRHAGQELSYGAGSAVFFDYGRADTTRAPSGGRMRNITISRSALKGLVSHPEDKAGHLVRPSAALHLLDAYLRSVAALDEPPPAPLGERMALHLVDLVAAALGPSADAREVVAGRGLKAARLHAALAEIAGRCTDPLLNIDTLAIRLGESRRSVQRLLEETGKSFTEHLTERRLARAHAMLIEPALAHLRVMDVALAAGFSDISHFNRRFRQRFGDSPSAARSSALHRRRE